MILGLFLYTMASASHRQFLRKEKLFSYTARDLMIPECPVAPGVMSLRQLMKEHMWPSGRESVVLTSGEKVEGLITRRLIRRVPRSQWDQVSGSSLAVPLEMFSVESSPVGSSMKWNSRGKAVAVGPGEPAEGVIEVMESKGLKQVLVIQEGILLGTIRLERLRDIT